MKFCDKNHIKRKFDSIRKKLNGEINDCVVLEDGDFEVSDFVVQADEPEGVEGLVWLDSDNGNIFAFVDGEWKKYEASKISDLSYDTFLELIDNDLLDAGTTVSIKHHVYHIIPGTNERNDTNREIPELDLVFTVEQQGQRVFKNVVCLQHPEDDLIYDLDANNLGYLQPTEHEGGLYFSQNNPFYMKSYGRYVVQRTYCLDCTALDFIGNGVFDTNGDERYSWCLYAPSVNIASYPDFMSSKIGLTAESVNLYDADTEPYGYKDVFMFNHQHEKLPTNGYIVTESEEKAFFSGVPNIGLQNYTQSVGLVNDGNFEIIDLRLKVPTHYEYEGVRINGRVFRLIQENFVANLIKVARDNSDGAGVNGDFIGWTNCLNEGLVADISEIVSHGKASNNIVVVPSFARGWSNYNWRTTVVNGSKHIFFFPNANGSNIEESYIDNSSKIMITHSGTGKDTTKLVDLQGQVADLPYIIYASGSKSIYARSINDFGADYSFDDDTVHGSSYRATNLSVNLGSTDLVVGHLNLSSNGGALTLEISSIGCVPNVDYPIYLNLDANTDVRIVHNTTSATDTIQCSTGADIDTAVTGNKFIRLERVGLKWIAY